MSYPGYYEIDGVVYYLYAAINPKWRQAGSNRVLGGEFVPQLIGAGGYKGPFLFDPCNIAQYDNLRNTAALRSHAGYPLQYALQPDPQQQRDWQSGARTERPDTVIYTGMPPRVLFDGQTFADDNEVAQYITRTGGATDNTDDQVA